MNEIKRILFESKYKTWIWTGIILTILFWAGVIQVQISINFGNSGY